MAEIFEICGSIRDCENSQMGGPATPQGTPFGPGIVSRHKDIGGAAIWSEAMALVHLSQGLDDNFDRAVDLILCSAGRLILSGIGKSGHIARKISSTFASTGTPSLFLHPAEASHGDLGMITRKDIVLAISKSGESAELVDVVQFCCRYGIPLIAITAKRESALGRAADLVLALPDIPEACPLDLAPTSSTVMTLALGDALAVSCLHRRDFRPDDFREFHPGGKLGQKLSRVKEIMYKDKYLPLVGLDDTVGAGILEMTRTQLGCVGVIDQMGRLAGIFTDGDLRRKFSAELVDQPIRQHMSSTPFEMTADALVQDVARLFNEKRIPSVFVTEGGRPIGLVHMHSLLGGGLV